MRKTPIQGLAFVLLLASLPLISIGATGDVGFYRAQTYSPRPRRPDPRDRALPLGALRRRDRPSR